MYKSMLIGCGSVGKKHLNILQHFSSEVLVIDPERPECISSSHNVFWYQSLDGLIQVLLI